VQSHERRHRLERKREQRVFEKGGCDGTTRQDDPGLDNSEETSCKVRKNAMVIIT
jgi:hypothetical protein